MRTTTKAPRWRARSRTGSLLAVALATLVASLPAFADARGGTRFGGDFTLTDHRGRTFSLADARGKVVLLHFGFTSCADSCPTTMVKVAAALRALGKAAERVQPILVTLDTKRDTPEVLRRYVAHFHPAYLGLTGRQQDVETVAKQYRTPVHVHAPDAHGAYAVDHGSSLFLIDTDGRLARTIFFDTPPDRIARYVKRLLNATVSAAHR